MRTTMTMAALGAALFAAAGASAADFSGGGAAGVALSRGYAAAPGLGSPPGRGAAEGDVDPPRASPRPLPDDAAFTAVVGRGTALAPAGDR